MAGDQRNRRLCISNNSRPEHKEISWLTGGSPASTSRSNRVPSKLDEEAITENTVYSFNSNEFQDKIAPQGYRFLRASQFRFSKYNYATEGAEVEKTIVMPHEKNAVTALYKVQVKNQRVSFRVYPLLNFRHFHSTTDMHSKTILYQRVHHGAWKSPLRNLK